MNEWVWSIGGMILTGETEVLGKEPYTSSVVDEWMSVDLWWNNADRERAQSTCRKTSPSANLSTTNSKVEKVQYIFYSNKNIKIKFIEL